MYPLNMIKPQCENPQCKNVQGLSVIRVFSSEGKGTHNGHMVRIQDQANYNWFLIQLHCVDISFLHPLGLVPAHVPAWSLRSQALCVTNSFIIMITRKLVLGVHHSGIYSLLLFLRELSDFPFDGDHYIVAFW